MFEPSYISWFFMGILLWICSFYSWRSYQKEEVVTLRDLTSFFVHMGIFMVLMGLPGILPADFGSVQLGAFYVFGHIFLYSSIAYYSRIPVRILKPGFTDSVFALNLAAGVIITLITILLWPMPEIHQGIVMLNVPMPIGPMIGVMAILNWVLGGFAFFTWRAKENEGKARLKMVFTGFGLLLLAVGGPMHDHAMSVYMLAVADTITLLGVFSLMAGVFYGREEAVDVPDYREAIRSIIKENERIVGPVAFTKAEEVEGISINNGQVTIDREEGEVSSDDVLTLVGKYRDIQGLAVNSVVRTSLKGIVELHHYTDLPSELLPFRVREGKFFGITD